MCSKCSGRLGRGGVAASDQTVIPPAATSTASGVRIAGQDVSRIAAGVWILASIVLLWLSGSRGALAVLLAPSWLGALLPLIRNADLTTWTERTEEKLLAGHARASGKTGKFARYFIAPLYRGSLFIWRKTQPVSDAHLRAGVRVAAVSYFAVLMTTLLLFVGYVVVGIVIAIAVVLITIWVFTLTLPEKSRGARSHWDYDSKPEPRIRTSRPTTDLLGRPKTEHFDESGHKMGESRPATDFLGSRKEEHFDESGRKIGESRPATEFFRAPKTEHFDESGHKTGESRRTADILGNRKVVHFDEEGNKAGESHPGTDAFGRPIVRHDKK